MEKVIKKIICANWKMNPLTLKEAEKLVNDIAKNITTIKKTEIAVCPPFLYLEKLRKISKKIIIGAQDAFPGDVGAFTGEVSAEMLYLLGTKYVILGHSERRALGETNDDVNKKIKASIASGLYPILCVGERTRDESHDYFNLIKTQLEVCLSGISKNSTAKIIVAYEPIWAISTTPDRRDATADDSREMAVFIRKNLFDKFGKDATQIRVLYGGSVNEKTAGDFLENGGVDGLLVGQASLDAKKFSTIIKTCEALNK
ncbi:MAG: triose-phosphate isomerase [Candidatus Pacebacteria bacterium]|nr:triose-phosphate isomerase [Candidatus Paceibacterota bacterium]